MDKEYTNGTVTKLKSLNMSTLTILGFLPQSLRYLYASHLGAIFANGHDEYVTNENNILYVDISYAKLSKIPLVYRLNKLQGEDLNNNEIKFVHPDLLYRSPNLRYLNLCHNSLNEADLNKSLSGVVMFEWSDFDDNNQNHLLIFFDKSFSENPRLNLILKFQNSTKLKLLDLSNCALTNLSTTIMKELDDIQSNNERT